MHLEEHNQCFGVKILFGTLLGSAFKETGYHGQSLSVQAEIRKQKIRKSVNLARAVRISGDGGQEGRHLAKRKEGGVGGRNEHALKPSNAAQHAIPT